MSIADSYLAHSRETQSRRRGGLRFAGKVLFALAIVLSAALALTETELLVAKAGQLSDAEMATILSAGGSCAGCIE